MEKHTYKFIYLQQSGKTAVLMQETEFDI